MNREEFEASLKSVETENTLDLYFYRPIGFRIARVLQYTEVSPNMITVLSIFVGAGTGYMFYFDDPATNLMGILLLVLANILDCVDGQLARLTGVKSKIGRILDGIAGDIWFILIYIGLAMRLMHSSGTGWFFLPAVVSGLSHLIQANITDYYKTLHLYFVSKEKGREFHRLEQVQAEYQTMKKGLTRFFYKLYERYTGIQESMTPVLQCLLKTLSQRYGEDIPEDIRLDFRRQSCWLMKRCIDFMTFNGRTVVLFLVVLSGHVWIYFIYETVILNFILYLAIRRHERMCRNIGEKIAARPLKRS